MWNVDDSYRHCDTSYPNIYTLTDIHTNTGHNLPVTAVSIRAKLASSA